jgi:hypothetical protein
VFLISDDFNMRGFRALNADVYEVYEVKLSADEDPGAKEGILEHKIQHCKSLLKNRLP